MDPGQSSRSHGDGDGDEVWAKLVPNDSRYQEIEIRSQDAVVCSEVTESVEGEKVAWCEISWNSGRGSARIRNLSANEIIVDGAAVGEEAVDLECGSEITAGPDKQGFLSYNFQVMPSQKNNFKSPKISFDIEHAKCSICLNIWHDVVTVSPCLHNFCNGCFSEWLKRSSSQTQNRHNSAVCPQCRAVVHSVGRNHFLHNIEETILQMFSSLKRSDEEIAHLDTNASVKSILVLGSKKQSSRKRPLSVSSDESSEMEFPCPQCDTEIRGFRCNRTTTHLICHGCGGLMPSRSDVEVPQHCIGCNRSFCASYWLSQGMGRNEYETICDEETFRPIREWSITRVPDFIHQYNLYEKAVTERCIQQTGKTLQTLISEWIIKFNNREIDRSRLLLDHRESLTSGTRLCKLCYDKLVDFLLYWFRVSLPRSLLPPDVAEREDCWYGYLCRTQHHNQEHARKRNHVCRPSRGRVTHNS